MPAAPLLNYADREVLKRLGRRRRWLVPLGLVAALLLAGWIAYDPILKPLKHRGRLWYLTWQCRRAESPPTFVVYEEDPAEVARLSPNLYTIARNIGGSSTAAAVYRDPRLVAHWGAYGYLPNDESRAASAVGPSATLFLHERRTAKGQARLVHVRYGNGGGVSWRGWNSQTTYLEGDLFDSSTGTWTPASPRGEWAELLRQVENYDLFVPNMSRGCRRFYAGQPDPDDESRFTIRCFVGQTELILDGQLVDGPSGPVAWVKPRTAATMPAAVQLKYSNECCAYQPPATQVVFENAPARAAVLLQAGGPYVGSRDWADGSMMDESGPRAAAHCGPDCWSRLGVVQPSFNAYVRKQIRPMVYLHERTSRAGIRRLIRVDLIWDSTDRSPQPAGWEVTVVDPATPGRPAILIGEAQQLLPRLSFTNPVRFYAGQSDPANPARFTVAYEIDGVKPVRGVLEGWLSDNGTTVELKGWPTGDE